MSELGRLPGTLTDARRARWYTGLVVAAEMDGTYRVYVRELNATFAGIWRSGPDRRRLTPGERCAIRHRGLALEIL